MYQVNNSLIFSRKSMGIEEFLNQRVESLRITIDKRPKGRPNIIEKY